MAFKRILDHRKTESMLGLSWFDLVPETGVPHSSLGIWWESVSKDSNFEVLPWQFLLDDPKWGSVIFFAAALFCTLSNFGFRRYFAWNRTSLWRAGRKRNLANISTRIIRKYTLIVRMYIYIYKYIYDTVYIYDTGYVHICIFKTIYIWLYIYV